MITVQKCSKAIVTYGESLNVELSVGLLVFAIDGYVDSATKEFLTEAFEGAACTKPSELVTACAELYNRLGAEIIRDWIDNRGDMRMVQSIAKHIEPYGFRSIADVKGFCRVAPTNAIIFRPIRQNSMAA